VYDEFKQQLVEATRTLSVGTSDSDYLGPVINEEQMTNMLGSVERARANGASVIAGGHRLTGPGYDGGFFVAPTLIEHVGPNDEISRSELFGPITTLYRVRDFQEPM